MHPNAAMQKYFKNQNKNKFIKNRQNYGLLFIIWKTPENEKGMR